jgi:hypothetical protein
MTAPNKRDYQKENLNDTRARKDARIRNNQARQKAIKEGKVSVGDGFDLAHSKPLAKGKAFVQAASENRSFPRTKTARRKK